MRSWPIFLDLESLRIYMAVLALDADFALLQVSIQMYKCFGNQDLNIRNCRQLFIFSLSTLQIIIHVIKLSCNVLLSSNLGKVERPIWNSSLASLDIIACSGNFFPLFNLLHLPAQSFKQNPDWNILIL